MYSPSVRWPADRSCLQKCWTVVLCLAELRGEERERLTVGGADVLGVVDVREFEQLAEDLRTLVAESLRVGLSL